MSIFSMHASWFLLRDEDITDEQRREAGLEVALEMIGAGPDPAQASQGEAEAAKERVAAPRG
jgi:hypothetical protein